MGLCVGDYDRKLYRGSWGKGNQCEVDVHGNVEIDKGDLLFLDRADGLRSKGISTADYYAYPFSKISGATVALASNRVLASDNFLGVAAWHSDSGVTEKITAHIDGLFKYPLKNSRTLKVGYWVVPSGSGVTLYGQKVQIESSSTSNRIGIVGNSGTFQSQVEFGILSIFGIENTLL